MNKSQESLSAMSISPSPAVLLTPGRTRNIAQDMEALRISRQDNPYLQQVIASRESLIESHVEECDSDDIILMSQEFGSSAINFVEEDPLTLKEVHDHMIRSPPPTNVWPIDTLANRTSSAFDFGEGFMYRSIDTEHKDTSGRSPRRSKGFELNIGRVRSSRSASPRAHDLHGNGRPLSLPVETHFRQALNKRQNRSESSERFVLLQQPRQRRVSQKSDSERLVSRCNN